MHAPDQAQTQEQLAAQLGAELREPLTWHGVATLRYYAGDWTADEIDRGFAGPPIAEVVGENLLMNAGIQVMLDLLIGAAGTTFANGNTYIGVGDSSAAVAAGQTDLQASTNRFKRVMDATFPSRSGQTLTFRTTYGTSEANFAINEVGVFNGGPAFATGTMLNRIVQALGTKTSAVTLQATVTVTIS